MDTNTKPMHVAGAAVTGARHARMERNGQDAVAVWAGKGAAVVVVCDGCGSGASSEVGARLGAKLFATVVARRLVAGADVVAEATWASARAETAAVLATVVEQLGGDREDAIHESFLFTIVGAAATAAGAAVWALGDGAYAIDDLQRELGPYDANQPPYLAYDLLGDPREAHLAVLAASRGTIIVATDGVFDLATPLVELAPPKLLAHPDALRRRLAVLARPHERIDWEARRIVRTPAALQDDCAVGVLRWGLA